ncbi:MAG: hypothetical protein WC358_02945 [Ignavibacteria bacterium]|jgi:hypothetical protein
MTSKVDTFGLLIDNFSSITQESLTANFSHLISFTNAKGIKSGDNVLPIVTYSGASLSKDSAAMVISTGDSYQEYTNYEKISIQSIPIGLSAANPDVVEFKYAIKNINQDPYNTNTVSHDSFEKIDPNYSKDELEFSVQLSPDYSVSIVFAKAPPARKVRYPELFNESIHSSNSFWNYTASNITDICEDEFVNSNERIVYVRVKQSSSIVSMDSGSFKNFTLTSLGKDGRFATKKDIVSYMASNGVTLVEDSNGYVYNELMYPLKSNNSIIDMCKINENNKLYVKFSIEIFDEYFPETDTTVKYSQIIASVYSQDNQTALYSDTIQMPYFTLDDISSKVSVSSKVNPNDITISSLEVYSELVDNTVDPIIGGRYAPPNIYAFITETWGSNYVYSLDEPISVPLDKNISFQAKPSKRNVNVNQIWTSIDGAPFTNISTVTLVGTAKYGEHVFRAYVKGLGTIEDSLVVERTFVITPVLPPPEYTTYESEILVVELISSFDILYSTDGNVPDLINRTNVASYINPLTISKKTVIKAVSVFDNQYSEVVEFVFDPDSVFETLATLPTVTLSGTTNPAGEYTSIVVATFTGYTGVAYYTLDGTDPLDDKNLSRRVYIEPFNILPIGSKTVTLNYGVIEGGKHSASTYGVI